MNRTIYTVLAGLSLLLILVSFSIPSGENIIDDILSNTNDYRKSRGLAKLTMRDDLNTIAQTHSENMARGKVRFGHGGFAKRQLQVKRIDKNVSRFAENVAYGATTGKEAVDGWIKSPGHRENLLGPYKHIGIGIARDKKGALYYTQLFVD